MYSLGRQFAKFRSKELGKEDSLLVKLMFDDNSGNDTVPYSTILQVKFPGYMHELFRYTSKTKGYNASTHELISTMNGKSHVTFPNCSICGALNLTKYTLDCLKKKEKKGVIKD